MSHRKDLLSYFFFFLSFFFPFGTVDGGKAVSGEGKALFIIRLLLPQQGKHCLYKTSKVAATDISSILHEPLPNQISLFSLILSLTSKETVKTRIPTGCAPVIQYIFVAWRFQQ